MCGFSDCFSTPFHNFLEFEAKTTLIQTIDTAMHATSNTYAGTNPCNGCSLSRLAGFDMIRKRSASKQTPTANIKRELIAIQHVISADELILLEEDFPPPGAGTGACGTCLQLSSDVGTTVLASAASVP